jgi:hypothetical protein
MNDDEMTIYAGSPSNVVPQGLGKTGFFDSYCIKCVGGPIVSDSEYGPYWRRFRNGWKCPNGRLTLSKRIPPEDCPYVLEITVDRLDKESCVKCNEKEWCSESEDLWEQGTVWCTAAQKYISTQSMRPKNCTFSKGPMV